MSEARTKSGSLAAPVPCPACVDTLGPCSLCDGARFVSLTAALEHGKTCDTDPAPAPESDTESKK